MDATIGLDEFAFELPEDFHGNGSFRVENHGSLDHELSILRVDDGANRQDVQVQ